MSLSNMKDSVNPSGSIQHLLKAARFLSVLLFAVSVLFLSARQVLAANPAGDLDQCRNGTYASPVSCVDGITPLGWVNGNANGNQAHWTENQSVPFRMKLTNMTDGQHVLTIRYDYTDPGGEHAYDFLTTYNRSDPGADPCSGFLSPCPAPSTFPIPLDPVLATCTTPQHAVGTGGVPQLPGDFTIWNGTITGASYVGTHACEGKAIQVSMAITFTTSGSTEALIAWSARIAPEFDWGNGLSAHAISGSPYHMTFIDLDGQGGNQDRSISTAAIYSTDLKTTVSHTYLTTYTPVFDTATIVGMVGSNSAVTPAIEGTLNFYICADNTVPFEAPFPNGCDHSSGTLLTTTPIAVLGDGDYVSPTYTPTQNGYYCFRAEFTPAAGSPYPFARESNASITNPYAECFLVENPLPVRIASVGATSNGGLNTMLLSAAAVLLLGLSALALDGRMFNRSK